MSCLFMSLQCILESLLLNIEVLYANHWKKNIGNLEIIETPKFQISPSPSIYGCNRYFNTLDCLSFAHKKLNEYRSLIKKKRKKKRV